MHSIEIKNFGPVDHCKMVLDKNLNILIGQQATGKSTIVKLIYFCEAVKDELYNFLLDEKQLAENDIKNLLRMFVGTLVGKFKDFFGSTRHYDDYEIKFHYGEGKELIISKRGEQFGRIEFSKNFFTHTIHDIIVASKDYYLNIDTKDVQIAMSKDELYQRQAKTDVNMAFESDYYISLFIPAGRYWSTIASELDSNIKTDYLLQRFSNYVKMIKKNYKIKLDEIAENETYFYRQDDNYRDTFDRAVKIIRKVLKGDYVYSNFDEKIVFGENANDFIYLSQASSGQQEVLWILLIIFDVIIRNRKVILIIEEPEAHIFPETQKLIVELIALLVNHTESRVFVTTHSPYILTSANLLIHSAKVENRVTNEEAVINKKLRIDNSNISAFMLTRNGEFAYENIIDDKSGLIISEHIDGVSDEININTDKLIDLEVKYNI